MRHHGWELPYHPLQIVAIAVFFALVFGFYVFIIPFTGSRILEIFTIATYSPTIFVVSAVYLWCVAANPADVGVRISKRRLPAASSARSSKVARTENEATTGTQADEHLSSLHSENMNASAATADCSNMKHSLNFTFCHVLLSGLASLVQTCTPDPSPDTPSSEDGMLYCSMCKVGICKCSKHCRVCDKCVDGFDHHCKWLNNCVGRRNYGGFVILMASGIMMLILQWSIGLWVMVHFFLNLKHFKNIIASKLGSSFSAIAYIIVVALCTLLAMVATYPLAQLFCFHILLMKKGIRTYDYIIAMKEQQLKMGAESVLSPFTSPASSDASPNSGTGSSGVAHGKAWCTPPRLFFDDEHGVFPPESSYSKKYVNEVLPPRVLPEENLRRKTAVTLSPWALASLKKEDVLHAAAIARKQSSTLRPLAPSREKKVMEEQSSSLSIWKDMTAEFLPPLEIQSGAMKVAEPDLNCTEQSFVISSWQNGKLPLDTLQQQVGFERNSGNTNKHAERGKKVLNPVQMEARIAFKTSREFSVSGNPVSSPESSEDSLGGLGLPHSSFVPTDWRWIENSANGDDLDGSDYESTDDSEWAKSLAHERSKDKALSFPHQGNLQYSTIGKAFVPEISARSSTFIPNTGDKTKVETMVQSYNHCADGHSRMATAKDVPS